MLFFCVPFLSGESSGDHLVIRMSEKCSSCPLQTFRKWRESRKTDKEKKEGEAEAERKRKGHLTGREIFMEVSSLMDLST